MDSYCSRIMNIPLKASVEECPNETVKHTYKAAHRDARHAAAEIAIEAEREIGELKDALAGLDEAYCRAGTGLTREERFEDRKRLMRARKALSNADKDNQND